MEARQDMHRVRLNPHVVADHIGPNREADILRTNSPSQPYGHYVTHGDCQIVNTHVSLGTLHESEICSPSPCFHTGRCNTFLFVYRAWHNSRLAPVVCTLQGKPPSQNHTTFRKSEFVVRNIASKVNNDQVLEPIRF